MHGIYILAGTDGSASGNRNMYAGAYYHMVCRRGFNGNDSFPLRSEHLGTADCVYCGIFAATDFHKAMGSEVHQ